MKLGKDVHSLIKVFHVLGSIQRSLYPWIYFRWRWTWWGVWGCGSRRWRCCRGSVWWYPGRTPALLQTSRQSSPLLPPPPPPSIPTEPTCDEIYDDTANPDDDIQEEYDDCVTAVPPPPPPTPGRSLPEIPGSRKPLPSVPPTPPPSIPKPLPNIPAPEVPKESKPDASSEPQIPPDEDYENMFLGEMGLQGRQKQRAGL